MKLKSTSIFLFLTILFLHKIDLVKFHAQKPISISNQDFITDNLAFSSIENSTNLTNDSSGNLFNDIFQFNDQVDEDDDSLHTNSPTVINNTISSYLSSVVFNNQSNYSIVSIPKNLSNKKYILHNVFRI